MALKERVLEALLGGEQLSGELLAERLGVTRGAIWKAVGQLREEGYSIQAGTNRGYVLVACDRLSAEAISHYGDGGYVLELHDCIGSTNDRAKELAAGGARALCVLSDRQDGGKGRMGRAFFSPAGSGLYLSLILHPAIRGEDCALITTYAAVAVAEAIEELTGAKAGIKWVNDVWIGTHKVCGILTEASVDFETGSFDYAVVGIGINVRKTVFPEPLSAVASDLETETGVQVDRNRLASALLCRFAEPDTAILSGGHLKGYRERCIILGKNVQVTRGSEQFPAKAVGINDRGELLVEVGGETRALSSGEVSVRMV